MFFLGQDSLSNKQNNKTIKQPFVQDSPCFKFYKAKIQHVQNKLGEDSSIPKLIHLKIPRRDGIESLMTLEEGEFKVSTDGGIR